MRLDDPRLGRSFRAARTSSLSLPVTLAPILCRGMESIVPPAESLPALYRAILDMVAELERRGRRADAVRIRSQAAAAYSTAWDEAGRRRLTQLHVRAWRLVQGPADRREVRRPAWRRLSPATRIAGR